MEYKKQLKIQDALEYTEKIINTTYDPIIILYEDLIVALANKSFYHAFEVESEETEGKFIFSLGNGQWDIPKFRQLLEEILPKTTSFDNFEIEHVFPHIGKRIMVVNACRIYVEDNRTKLIILTIKDITEKRRVEELQKKIMDLEERLKKNGKQ